MRQHCRDARGQFIALDLNDAGAIAAATAAVQTLTVPPAVPLLGAARPKHHPDFRGKSIERAHLRVNHLTGAGPAVPAATIA